MRKRSVTLVGLAGLAVVALLLLYRPDAAQRESKEILRSGVIALGPVRTDDASGRPKHRGSLRLEGQVMDDAERPVAGATVTMFEPADLSAKTEADGTFVFDGLASEYYSLFAVKDGLVGEATIRLRAASEPVIIRVHEGPTVTVRVVDADGGAPIAGAHVRTWGRASETADDGTARFRGVWAGHARFDITARGYEPTTVHLYPSDDAMAVVTRTVDLHRGATVSGTVVDPDGKLVANAEVLVQTAPDWEGRATTDPMGRWQFDALRAGKHLFSATSEIFAAAPELAIELDGKTPHPGIVIRVENGAQLVGTVVDPQGKPVGGARVWADWADARGWPFHSSDTTADANGKFGLLGMPSNIYRVWASVDKRASTRTTVNLPKNLRFEVRLVVEDSGLAGTVVDSRGNPVPDVFVNAWSTAGSYKTEVTDRHGAFDFGGLPPGAYEVSGRDRDDIATDTLKVNAGAAPLKLVLKEPTAVIGRVMLDRKPVTYYGVHVLVGHDESRSRHPHPFRTSDGRFKLERITPGTLSVIISGPGFGQKRIDDIRGLEGQTVDVGDIVVDRGIKIRGHVHDATGSPIMGAGVEVRRLHGYMIEDDPLNAIAQGVFHTSTNSAGEYEISGIAPSDPEFDPNRISARHPKHGVSEEQKLPPRDAVVDLTLSAVGGIDGIVHGGGGYVTATRSGRDEDLSAYTDVEGRFRFDNVVPGEYEVELRSDFGRVPPPTVQVRVAANERATATITVPAVKILLAIHAESGTCEFVVLAVERGARVMTTAQDSCEAGVGYIADVPPGAYQVCADTTCIPYRVTDQPPRQDVRIPAKR